MEKGYLLGIDIGTYESKGVLSDTMGRVIAQAVSPHLLKVPRPGYAEHDPMEDWWKDFIQIVRDLLEQSGIAPQEILCIGCSAIMAAITPVDEDCNPLRNAILYGIDTRAKKQAQALNACIGEDLLREVSGSVCTVESYGPKIKWIVDNEPELYRRTKKFTIAQGFVNARLTGRYCVDHYSVKRAQPMIDRRSMRWNEDFCRYVVPSEQLPEICRTTDVIGHVTPKAAVETGLFEGTPVICGTTDAGAEAVSAGVVNPGDTMVMYGSTLYIVHLEADTFSQGSIRPEPYVFPDVYATAFGMATTGSLTRWMRDQLAKDLMLAARAGGENAYDALFREAEKVPPGANGLIVLPYFSGERMPIQDPDAKGVFFGLNLSHTRGDLVKAALEGIGYGLCQNLDLLRNCGFSVDNVMAVGGGTKTRLWMQIMSDICGIRQQVPKVGIGACYGDAMLAGIGIGVISSKQCIKDWVQVEYETQPNPDFAKAYQHYKQIYTGLYRATKDFMHTI